MIIGERGMANKASYTSANAFPVKVLQDKGALDSEGRIYPRHIQLNVTNKCNISCSFCSCSDRDKPAEMPMNMVKNIAKEYSLLECDAVTITGGGEPLLHPDINEIIEVLYTAGMKVGLVTNGLLLGNLSPCSFAILDWARISFDDSRDTYKLFEEIENILNYNNVYEKRPDLAFSYVISRNPDFRRIKEVIDFANRYDFTHVRLVSDLLNLKFIPDMECIEYQIKAMLVDDSKVIYQGRKDHERGAIRCLISLLKPVIDVDGNIYPCCGVQYAKDYSKNRYNETMCMGNIRTDIHRIFEEQKYFNGSDCDRCYYVSYNNILAALTENNIMHKEFV